MKATISGSQGFRKSAAKDLIKLHMKYEPHFPGTKKIFAQVTWYLKHFNTF